MQTGQQHHQGFSPVGLAYDQSMQHQAGLQCSPASVGICMQADAGVTPSWTGGETPGIGATPKKQRSRWDETPMGVAPSATPMMGATPFMTPGATPLMTPGMAAGMETPSPSALQPGVGYTVAVTHARLHELLIWAVDMPGNACESRLGVCHLANTVG